MIKPLPVALQPKLPITDEDKEDLPIWLAEIPDKYEDVPLGRKIPALLEPTNALIVMSLKGYIVASLVDLDDGRCSDLTFEP